MSARTSFSTRCTTWRCSNARSALSTRRRRWSAGTCPRNSPRCELLLAHHLKALKLPTFLREYDKLAQQCAAEGVDHPRYLLRLAELELIDRERRMVERRIKEARCEYAWNKDPVFGVIGIR